MEDVISQFGLKKEMAELAPNDQLLMLAPLDGRDPDEALTHVAYIKGSWFLTFLEKRFGARPSMRSRVAGSTSTRSRRR